MTTKPTRVNSVNKFVVPETSANDDKDPFYYDKNQRSNSTYPGDEDFKPPFSDVPVDEERKLAATHHKEEHADLSGIGAARNPSEFNDKPGEVLAKRRDSLAVDAPRRSNSRKPTGSYGTQDDLKPAPESSGPQPLFFAGGLPSTTSGQK